MNKLTAAEAFRRYAEMPDRTRNGLYKLLKAEGHTVARKTVEKWWEEGKWDARLSTAVLVKAADTAAVIAVEKAIAGTLEDTMPTTARMLEGLAHLVLASASNVTIQTVEELRTMALIVTNTAESMAKVRKTLAEANGTAATGDTTIEAVRVTHSQSPLAGVLANFDKMRAEATDA
jgi:hypothetical protein